MYFYKLCNNNAPVALQGQVLEFYAHNDAHAIELGKGYAKKLGWSHYDITDGFDLDATIYSIKETVADKHYWIALYADGTYDELYNTKDGAMQWIQEHRSHTRLRRLVLDEL